MKTAARTKVVLAALTALSSLAVTATATADEHRLGEHPAVLVKRMEAQRGYDYAAKFYPHPAWMYLDTAPAPGNVAGEDRKTKDVPAEAQPAKPIDVVARRR